MAVRVLVADDHALFREGLRRILASYPDIEVVATAANGREAVEMAGRLRPDVVLMDVRMPEMGGVQATASIRTALPDSQVIVLTVSDQDEDLFGAIRAGARGYLLKNVGEEELVEAIRRVSQGEAMLSPSLAVRLLDEMAGRRESGPEDAQGLTQRESEILALASQGLTNREIADRLHLSIHTVKTHVRHILDKLHVRNRAQAAALASGGAPPPRPDRRNPSG
ncbi:response regulator transcription factor [Carboxydochorda subterranea]|uniref:Response regulator transcription factor n=1 Tax=Carboxydichorda subterranea TaxID=3109565 RepID=A0ABZ1BWZ1_9FIRM|nr:response regulator transcription factor [Limnochorda sp. L945t]WRP16657.1 response regulator transcription factor [Limnochorda sp. L945t]